MQKKSKSGTINDDFEEIINKRTDEEILEILKKRNYYQPEAADIALREALKRDLIHSEQDLLRPEFRVKPLKRKIFPEIENKNSRDRIIKSLGRSFILAGILPLILGITHLNAAKSLEALFLMFFGLLWIFLSARLVLKGNRTDVNLLLGLTFISGFYVKTVFQTEENVVFMDVFITLVSYILIFYGLFFIRRLMKK